MKKLLLKIFTYIFIHNAYTMNFNHDWNNGYLNLNEDSMKFLKYQSFSISSQYLHYQQFQNEIQAETYFKQIQAAITCKQNLDQEKKKDLERYSTVSSQITQIILQIIEGLKKLPNSSTYQIADILFGKIIDTGFRFYLFPKKMKNFIKIGIKQIYNENEKTIFITASSQPYQELRELQERYLLRPYITQPFAD